MNTKVRALIWEECRVSGVLALYNLALGALFFAFSLFGDPSIPWKNGSDDFAFCIVLGFPLLSALLFVLGLFLPINPGIFLAYIVMLVVIPEAPVGY